MRFDYFDMLSGSPIYMPGVGHLRSPYLSELCPTRGIGYNGYKLYLNFLSWDKEHLLKYGRLMQYRGIEKLDRDAFSAYDVITLLPQTRELCRGVLSFFMLENLVWDAKARKYLVVSEEGEASLVGEVSRENFEDVRLAMMQLNYVGLDKDDAPITHSNEHTRELWEKAQAYLKELASTNTEAEKPEYKLSNIISKVCSVHTSYNLLNIYDLTVFQLYDAFFQMSYMRSSDLSERIFSNHGGEHFKFDDWLKPIQTNT